MGTLAAIPLYFLLAAFGTVTYLLATATVFAVGIWASDRAAREYGVHDHGSIVIDEVAGFLVSMAFLPVNLASVVLAFLAFRLFDIVKPWPVAWLDRHVTGGLGIMLDDLAAGILANVAVWIALSFLPV
jgi:phosphatidylglycerophosphatase A